MGAGLIGLLLKGGGIMENILTLRRYTLITIAYTALFVVQTKYNSRAAQAFLKLCCDCVCAMDV